jgi:hypothetical protein
MTAQNERRNVKPCSITLEITHHSLYAVVGTLDAELDYITSLQDDGI